MQEVSGSIPLSSTKTFSENLMIVSRKKRVNPSWARIGG